MLSSSDKKKLKDFCDNAQNPYIYYDNDADGLCSFLLLRKYLGKGEGIAIRSYPEIDESYANKALIGKADIIFVLDKPVLSPSFVLAFSQHHIPVVWVDHHLYGDKLEMENLHIFNPAKKESAEPVTALLYDFINQKNTSWIAMMGCLSDHYLPNFVDNFKKEYSEFWADKIKEPFDAYYGSEIGRLARALNFGLKDSNTNVVKLQEYLLNCNNPGEILAESEDNEEFRNTYYRLKKKYDKFLEQALENLDEKIVFFTYSGDTSMSADISNELSYKFPEKYIIVGYTKGHITNLSFRGHNVKKIFEKIKDEIPEMNGGGHMGAVGARIDTKDLTRLKEVFLNAIG